jgi:hypothetical protein
MVDILLTDDHGLQVPIEQVGKSILDYLQVNLKK